MLRARILKTNVREREMRITLLVLIAFLPLVGCIVSPEYGELWDSGTVDTGMVGQWHGHMSDQEHAVHIGIVSNAYKIHVTTTSAALGTMPSLQYSYSFRARDVQIGTNTFMLCPFLQLAMLEAVTQTNLPASSPMRTEASLLRVMLHEEDFTLLNLNSLTVQDPIDEGEIDGRILPPPNSQGRRPVDPPCVSHFDKKTLAQLARIFKEPKTWHSPITFKREDREQSPGAYSSKAANGPTENAQE